jgi:hypothetical protein
MKNNMVAEDKEQHEKPTKKIKSNGRHQLPVATPSTDNKKNLVKDTNGLNQANSIYNDLEPGDRYS